MNMNELLDLVNKEEKKEDRAKSAKIFAVGLVIVVTAWLAITTTAGAVKEIIFTQKLKEENMKDKPINSIETINEKVQNKAQVVSDCADDTAQKACNVIRDINGKIEDVKKDVGDGSHKMSKDFNKAAKDVSKELNKPIK